MGKAKLSLEDLGASIGLNPTGQQKEIAQPEQTPPKKVTAIDLGASIGLKKKVDGQQSATTLEPSGSEAQSTVIPKNYNFRNFIEQPVQEPLPGAKIQIGDREIDLESATPYYVENPQEYGIGLKKKIETKQALTPEEFSHVKNISGFDDKDAQLALLDTPTFLARKSAEKRENKKRAVLDYITSQDEGSKILGVSDNLFGNYDLENPENVSQVFQKLEATKKSLEAKAAQGMNQFDVAKRNESNLAKDELKPDSPFMQAYNNLKDWKALQITQEHIKKGITDPAIVGRAIQQGIDEERERAFTKSHAADLPTANPITAWRNIFKSSESDTPLQDFGIENEGANYLKEVLEYDIANKVLSGEAADSDIAAYKKASDDQNKLFEKYPDVRKVKLEEAIGYLKAKEEGITKDSEENGKFSRFGYVTTGEDVIRIAKDNGLYDTALDKQLVDKIASQQEVNPLTQFLLPAYAMYKRANAPIENFSFVGQGGQAIKDVLSNTGKSILDLTQIRTNRDISAEQYNEDVMNMWKKDQSKLDGLQKTIALVGNTTGQVVGQALTTLATSGVAKGAGLASKISQNVGSYGMGMLGAYDGAKKTMLDVTDSDAKAEAGALLISAITGLSEGIFRETKIFGDVFGKKIGNIISKIDEDKLFTEATRSKLSQALNSEIPRFVKNFVKEGNKDGIEEVLTAIGEDAIQATFGERKNFDIGETIQKVKDTYVSTLIGGSLAAGLAARTNVRANPNAATALYHASENPSFYISAIMDLQKRKQITDAEANKKISIINTAKNINNEISTVDDSLSDRQKAVYISLRTTQAQMQDMVEKTTDPTVKAKLEANIKMMDEEKDRILNGLQFNENLQPLNNLYDKEQLVREAQKKVDEDATPENIEALQKAKDEFSKDIVNYYTPLSEPVEGLDSEGVPTDPNTPPPTDENGNPITTTIQEPDAVSGEVDGGNFRVGKIDKPDVITTVEQYKEYLKSALLNKPTAEFEGIEKTLDKAEQDILNDTRASEKSKQLGIEAIKQLREESKAPTVTQSEKIEPTVSSVVDEKLSAPERKVLEERLESEHISSSSVGDSGNFKTISMWTGKRDVPYAPEEVAEVNSIYKKMPVIEKDGTDINWGKRQPLLLDVQRQVLKRVLTNDAALPKQDAKKTTATTLPQQEGSGVDVPQFAAKSDKHFEYVPIEEVDVYREFDRETDKKFDKKELDNLTEDIRKNGIKTPIQIKVDRNGNALIVEGNTRLAAAKRLGIKNIPVEIIEGEFGSINKDKAKPLPDIGRGELQRRQQKELGVKDINGAYSKGFTRVEQPTEPSTVSGKEEGSRKQKQLEIINKNNPAPNEYNTWIRKVEDIKTAEEAFATAKEDGAMYPDFSEKDMKNALDSGEVTIYSSQPIKEGVFVSPSKINAQEYAGGKGGKLYSKKVKIEDIAWIDEGEGQYAPVEQPKPEQPTVSNPQPIKEEVSITTEPESGKVASELRDVESVAKALVGVDLPNIFVSEDKGGILNRENYYRIAQEKFQESKGLTTEEIFDKNKQKEQFKTEKGRLAFQKEFEKFAENADNKKKILAEAYHKAKKDGSNPELVKAVESLLSKEQATSSKSEIEAKKADIERRRREELYKTNLYEYDRKFKEFQTYGNTVKEAFDNLFEQVKNNPTNKELSDLLDYINERLVPEDIQKGSGKNPLVQEYIDENQQSIEKASKSTKSTISKINAKYDAELKAVESLLSKEQTPPALRAVESTAKALGDNKHEIKNKRTSDEKYVRYNPDDVLPLLKEAIKKRFPDLDENDLNDISENIKQKVLFDEAFQWYKDNDYTYEEAKKELDDNDVDYNEKDLKAIFAEKKEKSVNEKRLQNRAFDGTTDEELKSFIEDYGLTYDTESQIIAEKEANDIINEVGLEKAFQAVQNGYINGAQAAVIYAKMVDDIEAQLQKGNLSEEEQTRLKELQAYSVDIFDNAARDAGRFIAMLKRVYHKSLFTYDAMVKSAENAKGTPLTEEERLIIKEQAEKIAELDKTIKELEEKLEQERAENAVQKIKANNNKPKSVAFKARGKALADKVRKLKTKGSTLKDADGNPINLTQNSIITYNDIIEMIARTIEKTGEILDGIDTALNEIKKQDWYEKLSQRDKDAVDKQIKQDILDLDDDVSDDKFKIPHSLIREIVKNGTEDIDGIVKKVLEVYHDIYPDLDERKVRDIITKYGEQKNDTRDDIDKKISEAKRIGRHLSGKEDLLNGKPPKRSGFKRDNPTPTERLLMQEIQQLLKNIPKSQEEIDNLWTTALEKAKTRITNRIEELQLAIDKKERINKTKNVQNYNDPDLDKLKDDLKAKQKEYDDLFPKEKTELSDEQRLILSVNAKKKQLKTLQSQKDSKVYERNKKDAPDRSKFPKLDKEIKDLDDKIKGIKEEIKQDDSWVKHIEKKRISLAIKANQRRIEEYRRMINEKDFVVVKNPTPISDELTKVRRERQKVADEYELAKYKHELENRTLGQKIFDGIFEGLQLSKQFAATADLSAPLRQGATVMFSNPIIWAKAFWNMHGQAFSHQTYKDTIDAIKNSKYYDLAQDSKLAITDADSINERKRDEQFVSKLMDSNFMKKAPILAQYRQINKGSERAYSGFLNNITFNLFEKGAKELEQAGYTFSDNPKMYKALATTINNLTGRGWSPSGNEGKLLNFVLFSPKMLTSRVLLMYDLLRTDIPLNSPSRKMAAKSLLGTAAWISIFNILGTMAVNALDDDDYKEEKVNINPIATDFIKVRSKQTTFDPTAGYAPLVRTLARIITEKSINASGKEKDLSKGYGQTRFSPFWDFMENKLSPTASYGLSLLTHKNPQNKFEDASKAEWNDYITPLFVPLQAMQLVENFNDKDSFGKDFIEVALGLYGIGVAQYDNTSKGNKNANSQTGNRRTERDNTARTTNRRTER